MVDHLVVPKSNSRLRVEDGSYVVYIKPKVFQIIFSNMGNIKCPLDYQPIFQSSPSVFTQPFRSKVRTGTALSEVSA